MKRQKKSKPEVPHWEPLPAQKFAPLQIAGIALRLTGPRFGILKGCEKLAGG